MTSGQITPFKVELEGWELPPCKLKSITCWPCELTALITFLLVLRLKIVVDGNYCDKNVGKTCLCPLSISLLLDLAMQSGPRPQMELLLPIWPINYKLYHISFWVSHLPNCCMDYRVLLLLPSCSNFRPTLNNKRENFNYNWQGGSWSEYLHFVIISPKISDSWL